MRKKRINTDSGQLDLTKWMVHKENADKKYILEESIKLDKDDDLKPKLAFGYGYKPDILKEGINKYKFSHKLEDGLSLYEFEPKLSYRIFTTLARILNYKCIGSELRNNNTVIKNKYFITDQNPDFIVKELNIGIKKIFSNYTT